MKLQANLSKPVQENYLGPNAVYHGYAGMPDDAGRVYTEEECELEAKRAGQLGLKIARTFYGWYAWEDGAWNWDSNRCRIFYRWVERMQREGIDVAIQAGWWLAKDVWGIGIGGGQSPFGVEGNWEASVQNYAEWVSESLHQLVEVRGFTNIKYLMMFTEAQNGKEPPEGKTIYEAFLDCVKAVHEQLVKDGRRQLVKMIGPNEGSTVDPQMMKWEAEHAAPYLDIFSSHNYLRALAADKNCVYDGVSSVNLTIPGARFHQDVNLKPHTRYRLSGWVRLDCPDPLHVSGQVLMGAFATTDDNMINAGGQLTSRLHRRSVHTFDAIEMVGDWTEYAMEFDSEEFTKARIGVFFDVKVPKSSGYFDKMSLVEVNDPAGENLLQDGSFETDAHWVIYSGDTLEVDCYDSWSRWCRTARSYLPEGTPFWYDEYNLPFIDRYGDPLHGTQLAIANAAFMNNGVQSSVLWTLFDQQWPNNHVYNADFFVDGDHRWGLMPTFFRSKAPYPAYYAFGILSRFLGGEGTKVYAGTNAEGLHLSVTHQADGSWSLLVVNNNSEEKDFDVELSDALGVSLKRYLYDPAKIVPTEEAKQIEADKEFGVNKGFADRLPANSFAVYTNRVR